MVLYLCRMYQSGLHAVLWSYISILMRHLAAEPGSTEGPLFPSQCSCGTILLTLYSIVWDWRVSWPWPMLLYWPKRFYRSLSSAIFPFHFFLSTDWYFEAGVLWLIWCRSLSPSYALSTSFNNNNNLIPSGTPFSGDYHATWSPRVHLFVVSTTQPGPPRPTFLW